MKQKISVLLLLAMICSLLFAVPAYAVGEGNVDGGGGGMGQGSSQNFWNTGNEGVRVTVVRVSDHAVVTTPIDLTNKSISAGIYHFGRVCKLQYSGGVGLSPVKGGYVRVNPSQALPKIISSNGSSNIAAIKSYFTDEQVVRSIANITGMQFDALVNGEYRLLIEPIAYYTFQGVFIATTATEAAMYDEILSGGLRRKMVSLTHKNLPLAMFLETADLGYSAWGGSRTTAASNADIKSSLGLGVVRFKDAPAEAPEVITFDYEYRTNTEVITAVNVSGGQSDPDNPVSVIFNVGGRSYTVSNVYYPNGDSQLAWIRWTTPSEPQTMTITVRVRGGGSVSNGTINVNIVNLNENSPPDPTADDRNDSFTRPSVPRKAQATSTNWGVWRPWWHAYWVWHSMGDGDGYWCDHGWWEFDLDRYSASLSASMTIAPDAKAPTASGKNMKSGYGFTEKVSTRVSTNQNSAVTAAQNAVTYFPEFQYHGFWRLLDRMGSGYNMTHEFKVNRYSTYGNRTHFTPIWYPDGSYTPYTWLIDCWTPAGMLSMNLTDSIIISGNLWSDWHIAPQNPN
ncbi:hypothetical protein [Sinanaerobacter chloroacetimidivorans]|uniref:Cadherin domain-containing protein n=1 Tax=Sinanaerobacter chloroacetimidivorans TaxID=2818044 RepID=A0A8J8B020_9FIRM|nr:hypothetical protein [Sinanaerobacter chloroacetimidivorans]MBR0596407.1 hypothetical protein [Sinanaerobacter chloroacetimidivorans]